jgi:periplasmic divalent cation tolerance protein
VTTPVVPPSTGTTGSPSPRVVVAITTLPPEADADAFVRALLDARLVACGTVLPGARSIYRWQGRIEEAAESVLLLKTTEGRLPALRERLPSLHPYDVPELLVVASDDGLPSYLAWVQEQVGID